MKISELKKSQKTAAGIAALAPHFERDDNHLQVVRGAMMMALIGRGAYVYRTHYASGATIWVELDQDGEAGRIVQIDKDRTFHDDGNLTRVEIIAMMARTLYVTAYASLCDEDRELEPRAGPGDDWMSVTPEDESGESQKFAEQLALEIERRNFAPLDKLYDYALSLITDERDCRREATTSEFGYCLVMESLGTGVGWGDNFPNHNLDLPDIDYYLYAAPDDVIEGAEPNKKLYPLNSSLYYLKELFL